MKYLIDSENLEQYTPPIEQKLPEGEIVKGYKFFWHEVQSSVPDDIYEDKDVLQYMKNIIILSCILQMYRIWLGTSIKINHWFRPQAYIKSLKDRGYPVAVNSDHEQARAVDTNVSVSTRNIEKWKSLCKMFGVYYSIGLYSWGMHLGIRYDRSNFFDNR